MTRDFFPEKTITGIKDVFIARQQTIAVAESVTSGLLQAAFSTADKAMDFYQGGMTAYNIGQKCRYFHIDPIHAIACNCVSEPIAQRLSAGVCEMFSSNWGIGITGFATPVPESGNKTFACFSICCNDEILLTKTVHADHKNAFETQLFYVHTLLDDLLALLAAGSAGR